MGTAKDSRLVINIKFAGSGQKLDQGPQNSESLSTDQRYPSSWSKNQGYCKYSRDNHPNPCFCCVGAWLVTAFQGKDSVRVKPTVCVPLSKLVNLTGH